MLFGKHINKYYLKYLYMLIPGFIALMIVDYAQLIIPRLYRQVVNGMNLGQVTDQATGNTVVFDIDYLLDKICLPLIIVILVIVTGRFLWRVCFYGSGIKVESGIRSEMFDHCKELSQNYYQHNKVGNLMSLFTNDLETVQECFSSGIMMFCDAVFLGIMAFINMVKMDLGLTLLAMIPMALLLSGTLFVGKYMTEKWQKRQEAFSALSDFSQESFAGIAVIKAFVKEGKELAAFEKLNRNNENANIAWTRLSVLFKIAVTLFVESVVCIILGYGGYLVFKGTFNAGQLIEFIGYFNAIIWPIMAVSQLIEMNSRGKASLRRISELLDSKPDMTDRPGVKEPAPLTGEIEFKDLTFSYPDSDRCALKNVSFKIKAGENVGIVGKTGSGKTTLVDLILRTYNVDDGRLFLDGTDVNQMPIKFVRKYAAYVPQDNFLFSDTIENNISFASEISGSKLVKDAAVMADIDDNISQFQKGYETVLGERGVTVSGGQKQRISIARALMKNAPILILDDSVSAVDVKTEKTILSHLREDRKGKTTILIAHRITTIESMDKIIFMEDGTVSAVGTHEELLKNNAEYAKMVALQRLHDLNGGVN